MKRILLFTVIALMMGFGYASAQNEAEIKFDTLTHDFGTFSEKESVVSYTFKFTNTGGSPLVIHQATASCGCTVPEYTKEPIQPGKTGVVSVTYNGAGKQPGHFKKTITLRTNGKAEMLRLSIEGYMKEEDEK
ncbi:hypothetical protein EZS27_036401 [termite gut metagenome]|uniref:DUF1573 domain-containing protein n=1 Tax=termite gut metagenome TaxID=433724 RepID=A0A5J4PUB9_9ZZZZ